MARVLEQVLSRQQEFASNALAFQNLKRSCSWHTQVQLYGQPKH